MEVVVIGEMGIFTCTWNSPPQCDKILGFLKIAVYIKWNDDLAVPSQIPNSLPSWRERLKIFLKPKAEDEASQHTEVNKWLETTENVHLVWKKLFANHTAAMCLWRSNVEKSNCCVYEGARLRQVFCLWRSKFETSVVFMKEQGWDKKVFCLWRSKVETSVVFMKEQVKWHVSHNT